MTMGRFGRKRSFPHATILVWNLMMVYMLSTLDFTNSFATLGMRTNSFGNRLHASDVDSGDNEIGVSFPMFELEGIEILKFELSEHKPLGCTAEESLSDSKEFTPDDMEDPLSPVFISGIVDDGNAMRAGLEMGDVILAISGIFQDSVEDVHCLGLDRVKTLVAGRPDELPLQIWVARGTTILEKHEAVLMKLCDTDFENSEKKIGNAISEFMNNGYAIADEVIEADCNEDEEVECMIDALCDLWGEECEEIGAIAKKDDSKDKDEKENRSNDDEKPKKSGYFSRSSPSGTFIRNPTTGKLENVDA